MRVEPANKCRSYATHERATAEADRFFAGMIPDARDRQHAVYWCIVPHWEATLYEGYPRWTVLAFILQPKWHHLALSIASHEWKVIA